MAKIRFNSLLCEFKEEKDENGNQIIQKYISLGRLCFWLTFIFMTIFWFWMEKDVPKSLYDVFYLMVLYNFFKKPLSVLNSETITAIFKIKS